MRGLRIAVGGAGVAVGLYGAWLLFDRQDGDQRLGAARWLVGGVVLHDVLLSALVLVAGAVVVRWVPGAARAPVTVGSIVLASVTLVAVPVLGRFGARADNATLLDRDYTLGWLVVAGVVFAGVTVASVLRHRRS